MDLVLIRHGLPERREDTADPPLTPEGLDQAMRVAELLSGESVDAVFSSTMVRAIQTAEPYAAVSGHDIQLREGIVEFDRGTGQYVPMEVLKRDDYEAWKAFVSGGYQMDISTFQKAVVDTLEDIITTNPSKAVAVFCHGGVINVWTAHILGMAPRLFFEPGYASVHRYLCARSGERNLVSLNERAHLKDLVVDG
jgi:2,3-bisphosphoglycerate-dependent phosphoglycerate mutase